MGNAHPAQGIVGTGTLAIDVSDPNVGDLLYVRWIAEYPPYNPQRTRMLTTDPVPPAVDGNPVPVTVEYPDLDCLSLAQGVSAHPVTALVSDGAFYTAEDTDLTPEQQLTNLRPHALGAEAHWVLNVACGQ